MEHLENGKFTAKVQNEPLRKDEPKSTAEAIAREVGVSGSTVRRAEKIQNFCQSRDCSFTLHIHHKK